MYTNVQFSLHKQSVQDVLVLLTLQYMLTLLPKIWLIAADSFKVHSATIFGLISFMYSMKAFNGFLIWVVRFSSRSRSRAALRLGGVALVITEGATPSTEHVLSSDWECGEKLPLGFGGDESRPPGPHLDNGLLKDEIQVQNYKKNPTFFHNDNFIYSIKYMPGTLSPVHLDLENDLIQSL